MDDTLNGFTAALASTAPTPGGGGAAGLMGALAAALGAMAASLSARRKDAETERLSALAARCEGLRARFLTEIDADAAAFLPLAAAYAVPKDAPGRAETLRSASLGACAAAEETLTLAGETAALLGELAPLVSPLLLSDLGCAASVCCAALLSAAYNILVNIRPYPEDSEAQRLRRLVEKTLEALLGLHGLELTVYQKLGGQL